MCFWCVHSVEFLLGCIEHFPRFGYLELKEVLTCVMNSKHFTLFMLLPGEVKIG